MSSVEIEITGYIAKPPEPRSTPDGKMLLQFSIAHKNYKDETEWYNCAIWGEKRVGSLNWLEKGMGVFVRGEINITVKDEKIYRNVTVDKLQVISGGKKQELSQSAESDDDFVPF